MFERLLLFGLAIVAIGLCIGAVAILSLAADATVSLWRRARSPRSSQPPRTSSTCAGCRNLGRRCPWCTEERWRGIVTTLAVPLPEVAWPIMVGSGISFSPRAQILTAVWSFAHLTLSLFLLFSP